MTYKHMKSSTSLVIKEIQIKTTMRHYFTPTRMARKSYIITNVDKDVEKLKSSYTVAM